MALKIKSTWDTVINLFTWLPFNVVIQAMQRSSFIQGKGRTYISQFFNDLSIGLVPGITLATSLSAVKLLADWASLAMVWINF